MSSGPDLAGSSVHERTSCSAGASPGRAGTRPPRPASRRPDLLTLAGQAGRRCRSPARALTRPWRARPGRPGPPSGPRRPRPGQPCPRSSCRSHDRPWSPRPRSRGRGTTATWTSSGKARSSPMPSPACRARSASDPGCPRSGAGRTGGRQGGPPRLETVNFAGKAPTANCSTRAAAAPGCAADRGRFRPSAHEPSASQPRSRGGAEQHCPQPCRGAGRRGVLPLPAPGASHAGWPYLTAHATAAGVNPTPAVLAADAVALPEARAITGPAGGHRPAPPTFAQARLPAPGSTPLQPQHPPQRARPTARPVAIEAQ
jgi:hypothetical protein